MKNVLFLGRKKWAAKALEFLIEGKHNVIGIVIIDNTNDIKYNQNSLVEIAKHHDISIYNHKELYNLINVENQTFDNKIIDIIISYLYSDRIKKNLLNIAKVASINLHPAPLPEYQGLGGYNLAILDGLNYYGVSAHLMTEKVDAGEILKINKFDIGNKETAFSLEQRSMHALIELFKEIFSSDFNNYLKNRYTNNTEDGKYLNRESFEKLKFINSDDSPETISRKVRAFWYPPYEGAKIKIGNHYYTLADQTVLNEVAMKYHD